MRRTTQQAYERLQAMIGQHARFTHLNSTTASPLSDVRPEGDMLVLYFSWTAEQVGATWWWVSGPHIKRINPDCTPITICDGGSSVHFSTFDAGTCTISRLHGNVVPCFDADMTQQELIDLLEFGLALPQHPLNTYRQRYDRFVRYIQESNDRRLTTVLRPLVDVLAPERNVITLQRQA